MRVMSCGWHQNAKPAAQLIGYQLTAEEEQIDQRKPGDQHSEDLQSRGVSWSEKETIAADCVRWRNLAHFPQGIGGSN